MRRKGNYLIIITVAVVVFGNTLLNGYNLDDHLVTESNFSSIKTIFSSTYIQSAGPSYGYRPITILTFYLENKIFGKNPQVSHAINLLLFIGLSLLVFKLLRQIFRDTDDYILLFIALLFVVHPVHTEVVASIKNRDEVLSLSFVLIALLFALNWIRSNSIYYLILVFLFCSLSILSKKSSLPVHLLIPLIIIFKEDVKIKSFTALLLCISVPISLFAYNFELRNGLLLLSCVLCVMLGTYFLNREIKKGSIKIKSTTDLFILSIFICLSVIGVFYSNVYFVLSGLLISLYITFANRKLFLTVSLLMILVAFVISRDLQFINFSIVLISYFLVQYGKGLKQNMIYIGLLICHILIFGFYKTNPISAIYIIPLIIFLPSKINRFLPLVMALVLSVIIANIGSIGVFSLSIVLLSGLFITSKYFVKLDRMVFTGVVVCLIFFSGTKHYNTDVNSQITNTEIKIIKNDKPLQVGRTLEYVENTLVKNHSEYQRIATGLATLGEYFRLMIFPHELSFYYGYSKISTTDFSKVSVWASLIIHLLLFYASIYFFKKQPLISIGALWYLASIFLFSNIPVLVAGMVGERLAFSASLGFCIVLGGIINWIKPQLNYKKPRVLEILSILLLVTFSARTFARNQKWESQVSLMSNDIGHLENSAQANYLLAVHLVKEAEKGGLGSSVDFDKANKAIKYFEKAIEIYPNHYNFHIDLGKAYLVVQQYELAKRSFLAANDLEPNAILGLFELAKVSFNLEQYKSVMNYTEQYLKQDTTNPIMYELAAFSAYYSDDYESSLLFTKQGLVQFPQNKPLNELLLDLKSRMQ